MKIGGDAKFVNGYEGPFILYTVYTVYCIYIPVQGRLWLTNFPELIGIYSMYLSLKNVYTKFVQMCITVRRKSGRLHKVYIFLFSMTRRADMLICLVVCPITSAIIKANDTKFGINMSI